MNTIFSQSLKIALFVMAVTLFCVTLYAEDVYYPYPIVFVHGINSSDGMWITMRDELRQNFKYGITNYGVEEYKYPNQISEMNYFTGCNYAEENNGNIENIAKFRLSASIDKALSYYPSFIPQSNRKVIIVCHSMGGLVVRSLLHQISSYKDKIHRVVFIDTPHLGSPYASALWLLNEVRLDAKSNSLYKNTMYRSYSAFSFPVLTYVEDIEYPLLHNRICNTQTNIDSFLAILDQFGPKPNEMAIDQLRLPGFTYYEADYRGFLSSVMIYKKYSAGDTFLGSGNLGIPKDYKVIVGKNTSGMQTTLWSLDKLLKFSDNFTFPTLAGETQSIDNAVRTGDGIVTKSSQEGIKGADYTASGFHAGITDKQDCIKSVLTAIDDPPEIERVYAVPCDWNEGQFYNYYIVIKAKEYLLADLEIESMDLDGRTVDLHEFRDPASGTYKPYYKFGKNFLKKRDNDKNIKDKNGNTIPLKPGEFYVKVYFPDVPGYGSIHDINFYTLNVTLKNPAGKTKKEHIQICNNRAEATFDAYIIDVPPYTLPPYDAYPRTTTMNNLYVHGSGSSNMHIQLVISGYNVAYPVLWNDDITLDSSGTFQATNCFRWNGSNGEGGKVSECNDIMFNLDILPADTSASPVNGDNKMNLPTRNHLCIVRADPTFIQTHRSYSQFAKFDTLKRFARYGYSLNPAYLNEADKTVRQGIDDAILNIVNTEESFNIEKEKIIAKARSLAQNQPSDLLEDKASADLIGQLAKDKETRVRAIMENVNNSVSAAFSEKASSARAE